MTSHAPEFHENRSVASRIYQGTTHTDKYQESLYQEDLSLENQANNCKRRPYLSSLKAALIKSAVSVRQQGAKTICAS